jgi:hypothetical protein
MADYFLKINGIAGESQNPRHRSIAGRIPRVGGLAIRG